jgi:hypothetical protein
MLVYVDDSCSKFIPDKLGWRLHKDICDHINQRFSIKKCEKGQRYGTEAKSFLGVHISHCWETNTVSLSLPAKIQAVLEMGNMQDCNPRPTVGVPNEILCAAKEGEEMCPKHLPYAGVCGAMLWISRIQRADCMQRSAELARFMHAPTMAHWRAAQHLLAYVQHTKDVKLVYKRDPTIDHDNFQFVMFVDADYAPDYGDVYRNMKSTLGWVATQNNVAVAWRSRKQPVMADSTSASEFIAAADASKQIVWMRRMYADFGHPIADPTITFEDNESCQKLVENYCGHDRVKHLHIRASIVRQHHARGLIKMSRVPDRDQLADVFTKVKAGPQMKRFRDWMLTGTLPDDCIITDTLKMVGHRHNDASTVVNTRA